MRETQETLEARAKNSMHICLVRVQKTLSSISGMSLVLIPSLCSILKRRGRGKGLSKSSKSYQISSIRWVEKEQ